MGGAVVLIRGAGDLASGVALRLFRSGFRVVMTEIRQPLAVRRTVSFSEAVYRGSIAVEGVTGRLVMGWEDTIAAIENAEIPVLIDPDLIIVRRDHASVDALVDARMLKQPVPPAPVEFVVGLGPGFVPGRNCAAVVETMRGHTLGRVYWDRPAAENTGLPDGNPARVLRAPQDGTIFPSVEIADRVQKGDVVAIVESGAGIKNVRAEVGGVVRGILPAGLHVRQGVKIGDIDARGEPSYCYLVSDKALAIGGGVLEALLSGR